MRTWQMQLSLEYNVCHPNCEESLTDSHREDPRRPPPPPPQYIARHAESVLPSHPRRHTVCPKDALVDLDSWLGSAPKSPLSTAGMLSSTQGAIDKAWQDATTTGATMAGTPTVRHDKRSRGIQSSASCNCVAFLSICPLRYVDCTLAYWRSGLSQ